MNYFCTQCGTPNNGGNFCITCGCPINNQIAQQTLYSQPVQVNTGRLILMRKGKVMGFAIDIHITINGLSYKLEAGNNISLDLAPGICQISYKVWCRREKTITINIVAGNYYLVDFVYDPLWGGFKIGKDSKLQ